MMGIFQQKYITEAEDFSTPEHYLWTSVLSKAAHDAIYSSDWREAKIAMSWFKDMSNNFKEVCNLAGKDPLYVHQKMVSPIAKREKHMEMVRNGQRYYVKEPPGPKITKHHNHYRGQQQGKLKRKHLMGNAYYKAKREKNLKMVLQGRKGGRPRMYNEV